MQIRRKIDTDTFGEISIGEVFKDSYDNFYMKIYNIEYRNNPTSLLVKGNAVNLESGTLLDFRDEDFVTPLEGAFFEG